MLCEIIDLYDVHKIVSDKKYSIHSCIKSFLIKKEEKYILLSSVVAVVIFMCKTAIFGLKLWIFSEIIHFYF